VSFITEDRTGGSTAYIRRGENGFYERNQTNRITGQLGIVHAINAATKLQLKSSYSRFDRVISIPGYRFDAEQGSSFSELTWNRAGERADWVAGLNLLTEDLMEKNPGTEGPRDYRYTTYGGFVQNAWTVSDAVVLETGLRGDYVSAFGWELLPRVSAMVRVTPSLTTRIGGGFGYKTPTLFTEEAERRQFRGVLPVHTLTTRNERSVGGNWDIHYRTSLGSVGLSINQLFYYTRLNHPLVLVSSAPGLAQFRNSTGYLDTKGMETNLRLVYDPFKLFVGYSYTDAHTHFGNREWLPLTARHRLNNVLMFEIEEKWKLGLEAYYFSRQRLNDGTEGRPYWITGFMAEKIWEHLSVFVNFENFTGTRQTKFGPLYTGSLEQPVFNDIYALVEGFIVNGGVKWRW
ncbi:MAG TPA: TonB-dependent receptor, partial [Chitinophagaceae bacterium]|nr:TonB-dependent receptor [Chitinophagaceae bacterium]